MVLFLGLVIPISAMLIAIGFLLGMIAEDMKACKELDRQSEQEHEQWLRERTEW